MRDIKTQRVFPFLVPGTALLVSLGGMGRAPLHNVTLEQARAFPVNSHAGATSTTEDENKGAGSYTNLVCQVKISGHLAGNCTNPGYEPEKFDEQSSLNMIEKSRGVVLLLHVSA